MSAVLSSSIHEASPSSVETARLRAEILDLSRQNRLGALTPWCSDRLDWAIGVGHFRSTDELEKISARIVADLADYRTQAGIDTVVLGMSGGVDSALTAALFKRAGWRVIGVTLPIHQDPVETERGIEAIRALRLDAHAHVDLSGAYDTLLGQLGDAALSSAADASKPVKIRRGNVRARVRMITLYNLAAAEGGLVASTDNLSELAAGFWTLHGDVGDLSPIQSLTKSWEVPAIAQIVGVPDATVRATPTDGLGIDAGDEAQLGCSYLEWDLIVLAMAKEARAGDTIETLAVRLGVDAATRPKFEAVYRRMGNSWFKRRNPLNLAHPFSDRFGAVDGIDRALFVPPVFG